jgi:hypothetical protein
LRRYIQEARRIRAIVSPFPGADRMAAAADSAFDTEDARWSQVAVEVDLRQGPPLVRFSAHPEPFFTNNFSQ